MNCNLKRFRNNPNCRKSGDATFNLIIPKRDNSGKPIKNDKLKPYIAKVNKIFGGSTTIPKVLGCYSEGKQFYCEENTMIMGARDFNSIYNDSLHKLNTEQRQKQIKQDYLYMQSLARKASKELGQDSIFVSASPALDVSTVKRKKSYKKELKKSMTEVDNTVFLSNI